MSLFLYPDIPLLDILGFPLFMSQSLGHYIKVNGLQDKVDRKIIRPDMKLTLVSLSGFVLQLSTCS